MKANLLDPVTQQVTLERLAQFQPDTPRQWGQMTPEETVCHMADFFRDALRLRAGKRAVPRLLQPFLRLFVLIEKDWKPNTPTLEVYRQGNGGGGTPPVDFETDKAALIDLINRFCAQPADQPYGPQLGIGQINREQNGFVLWKHTDHHLRQFGL